MRHAADDRRVVCARGGVDDGAVGGAAARGDAVGRVRRGGRAVGRRRLRDDGVLGGGRFGSGGRARRGAANGQAWVGARPARGGRRPDDRGVRVRAAAVPRPLDGGRAVVAAKAAERSAFQGEGAGEVESALQFTRIDGRAVRRPSPKLATHPTMFLQASVCVRPVRLRRVPSARDPAPRARRDPPERRLRQTHAVLRRWRREAAAAARRAAALRVRPHQVRED